MVQDYDSKNSIATIEQRNKFVIGDTVDFLRYDGRIFSQVVKEMYDENGEPITEAPHPQQIVKLRVEQEVKPFDMMRRESSDPVTLE